MLLLLPAHALAAPRNDLSAAACEGTGLPVIDVIEHVVEDVDSGEAGNYWAWDDVRRRIRVWEQADGDWCAIVTYRGVFDAEAGEASPGAGGTLEGTEHGTFRGGYRAIVQGELLETAAWAWTGFVGTTDYACAIDGDCPGYVDWTYQYFASDAVFSYEWWGWIYQGGPAGVWANTSDGNSGDILAP